MPDLVRMLQAQTELMSELPETLNELAKAVRGLADVVETSKATLSSVQRLAERIEVVVDDLEDPVRGLRPGLERLRGVLEDPVLERLPGMLESIDASVQPVAAALVRGRARLHAWRQLRLAAVARLRWSSSGA